MLARRAGEITDLMYTSVILSLPGRADAILKPCEMRRLDVEIQLMPPGAAGAGVVALHT